MPEKNGWEHTGEQDDLDLDLADWNKRLIDTMADGQDFAAERLATKLVHMTRAPGEYVRIDGSQEVSPAQRKNISLDNSSQAAIQALTQIGNAVGDHYRTRGLKTINPFFTKKKSYQTR